MFEAILIGLSAFVFIELLCAPYEVFGWWPPLLRKLLFNPINTRWGCRTGAIVAFDEMKWWQVAIYKPFAGCGVCNSGWWAMAYYFSHFKTFDFFAFVFFVVTAIFTAWVLEKVRDKII